MLQQLHTPTGGETTTGAKTAFTLPTGGGNSVGLLQVDITGTATVQIEGRLTSDAAWQSLLDSALSASDIISIAVLPQMRLNILTASSATIKAWLDAPYTV